jgi:hypothetical protein
MLVGGRISTVGGRIMPGPGPGPGTLVEVSVSTVGVGSAGEGSTVFSGPESAVPLPQATISDTKATIDSWDMRDTRFDLVLELVTFTEASPQPIV